MGEWMDHWDWWGDSTKVWRYWPVPVSFVFHHTLYYLLKKAIVRRVFDPIVRKQKNGEYMHTSNGYNAASGPNELQSTKGEGVKRLSDADVSNISAKYGFCSNSGDEAINFKIVMYLQTQALILLLHYVRSVCQPSLHVPDASPQFVY